MKQGLVAGCLQIHCVEVTTTPHPDPLPQGGRGWLDGEVLNDSRDALAHADAHGGQAVTALPPDELVHERRNNSHAAGAEWMPERNRAAVRIDTGRVELEIPDACDHLRREGFVQLDWLSDKGDHSSG